MQTPTDTCPRQDPAFTLIELLVVIAIVALLVGLLLPALGQARRAARTAVNLSNLRSLGQAMEMYSGEYRTLPPFRLPAGMRHPGTGRSQARWQWFVGDYVGRPFVPLTVEEEHIFETSNDMPRYDNAVFVDPLHKAEDFVNGSSGLVQALRNGSYGYNYHYLGNSRTSGPRFDNWPVSMARVSHPSRTISIADSLGNQTTYGSTGYREHSYTLDPPRLDTANNNARAFAQGSGKSPAQARHGGRATTAFLDGHAETLSLERLGYVVVDAERNQVEHDAGDNGLWNGMGYDPQKTVR